MWGAITGWPAVAVVFSVSIGIGFGVLGMNPPNIIIAKMAFSFAAIILLTRIGYWLAFEQSAPIVQRSIFAFIIFAVIGTLWLLSMNLVTKEERVGHNLKQQGFNLKIGGMVIMGINGDSTRIQLTVTVINHGYPTSAHGWNLVIRTSTRELNAFYMPGEQPAKGSLNVPPLDESLHRALGTNDEITGLLNFLLPKISQGEIEQLVDDPQAKLMLSVLDNTNRKWNGERNILEMASERFERRPSK